MTLLIEVDFESTLGPILFSTATIFCVSIRVCDNERARAIRILNELNFVIILNMMGDQYSEDNSICVTVAALFFFLQEAHVISADS